MTVWLSYSQGAPLELYMRVATSHGESSDPRDVAFVIIRSVYGTYGRTHDVSLGDGHLEGEDFEIVRRWILLNAQAIGRYWDEGDQDKLTRSLERLAPSLPGN